MLGDSLLYIPINNYFKQKEMRVTKTKKLMAVLALFATVFTACSEDEKNGPVSGDRVEAKFTSSINGVVTKAVDATWTPGDQIGIFMKTAGQPLAAASVLEGVNNLAYTTTGTTGAVPFTPVGTAAYFPPGDENVDFISYYPHQATLTNFIYPINVADQTSQEAIDLLYSDNATGLNGANPTVALTFVHQLTKLVFNIAPGTGVTAEELAGLAVTLQNMNTTANFNLADGTITNPAAPATITAFTNAAGTTSEAIVLPGDVSGKNILFTLGNSDAFTWPIPASTTFAAGSKITYTVTINRTGMTITGQITDWTNVNGGNVVPE